MSLVRRFTCSSLICLTSECRTSSPTARLFDTHLFDNWMSNKWVSNSWAVEQWSSDKKFSSNWPVEHVTAQLFDRPVVRQFSTKCTVDQVYCRTCGIFPIILLEMAQKKARRSINFPSLAIHKVFIFFRFQEASGIIGSPGTGILCTLTVIWKKEIGYKFKLPMLIFKMINKGSSFSHAR